MPIHRSRGLVALGVVSLVVLAALLGLARGGAEAATTLRLSADSDGDLRFNKESLSTEPGRVTIRMKNPSGSGIEHGIAVTGKGDGETASPGETATIRVRLREGRYTFYCPVGSHRSAGMRGSLRVR